MFVDYTDMKGALDTERLSTGRAINKHILCLFR